MTPHNRVNLLDRYLFKSVLGTCLGAVGLFAFVLMLGNAMKELSGYLIAGQIDLPTFLRLVSLLVPFVITFALPMGMLTGVLLTVGRLSADSEVTAMRSCGISLRRFTRPILLLAVLLAAGALYLNHQVMPWARLAYKKEIAEAARANPLKLIVPRSFIRQFPGKVVYVGEKKGSELGDLRIWLLDDKQRVLHYLQAERGKISYEEDVNTLVLTLHKSSIESRRESDPESNAEAQWIGSFEETEAVRLPLDRMFTKGVVRTKLDYMPYEQLMAEQARLAEAPAEESFEQRLARERGLARIDLVVSERFNNSIAVLSMALLGVPLGIRVSRRETSANLGVAVAVALGYFFLTTAISWLDKAPQYQPGLLLYLPNLLLLGLAMTLLGRAEKT